MKKTLAKTLRSVLSLVMALVMVVGTVGTTFAAQPTEDDLESAMETLVEVLEKYGSDVLDDAWEYVNDHGYIDAYDKAVDALYAAADKFVEEQKDLIDYLEDLMADTRKQVQELREQAEKLVYLIALYKAGMANGSAETAIVITIPGVGTVDTDDITDEMIKDFDIDDLTDDQKKAIEDSGLLGDVKLDDLTDEQIDAIKDAGLKGEINPDVFTEEQLKDLQNAQNSLNETIDAIEKAEETIDELEKTLADLEAELSKLQESIENIDDLGEAIVEALYKAVDEGYDWAIEEYLSLRKDLFEALAEMEKPYEAVVKALEDVSELVSTVVTEISDLVTFVAEDVYDYVSNNKMLVAGAIVAFLEEFGYTQEELEDIYEDVIEEAAAFVAELTEVVEEVKEEAHKAFRDATTADLHITYGTNYVAIGDAAAAADNSYVDLLNDALKIPVAVDKTMAVEGNLIQDTELNAAKIAEAELITIGYSVAGFAGSMFDAVLGEEVEWSKYLDAEAIWEIDRAMEEIEEYAAACGFAPETYEALTASIESIAFNTLAYMYELPNTIEAIREINPNAVLVVVGLDNPLEAVVASHDGYEVSLHELSTAIVALTDVYTLTYAMIAQNCTFVSAPCARNDFEGTVITEENFLETLLSEGLLPNAQGQKYIQERIYNALNVSYGFLWGDANLDGQVTYVDALMILRDAVGLENGDGIYYLPVCDVDGIAGIAYTDALMVLRRAVGLDDIFPVEK